MEVKGYIMSKAMICFSIILIMFLIWTIFHYFFISDEWWFINGNTIKILWVGFLLLFVPCLISDIDETKKHAEYGTCIDKQIESYNNDFTLVIEVEYRYLFKDRVGKIKIGVDSDTYKNIAIGDTLDLKNLEIINKD